MLTDDNIVSDFNGTITFSNHILYLRWHVTLQAIELRQPLRQLTSLDTKWLLDKQCDEASNTPRQASENDQRLHMSIPERIQLAPQTRVRTVMEATFIYHLPLLQMINKTGPKLSARNNTMSFSHNWREQTTLVSVCQTKQQQAHVQQKSRKNMVNTLWFRSIDIMVEHRVKRCLQRQSTETKTSR